MKGSTLTGTLECWRGSGEDEMPVDVAVTLHVWRSSQPFSLEDGLEVDVVEATADGQPFELTDAEIERAVQHFSEQAS